MSLARNRVSIKVKMLTAKLEERYGYPKRLKGDDPLNCLIRTILSQNTNDRNRDRAYSSLVRRFHTWDNMRKANIPAIAQTIRVGGLANIKAKRLKDILDHLSRLNRDRQLNLNFLKGLSPNEAKEKLCTFKGIGPKTASVVLLFALGKPAFPVDTHIFRVSNRLGILPKGCSREKAHDIMEQAVAKNKFYSLHLNMIEFGREICVARNPKCNICPLSKWCDYYKNRKV